VYIDGVRQSPSAYAEQTTTLFTLSEGLEAGQSVLAVINESQSRGVIDILESLILRFTAPELVFHETDGTAGVQGSVIKRDGDLLLHLTRVGAGTDVSTDYRATIGASGVTTHEWFIDGVVVLKLSTSGLATDTILELTLDNGVLIEGVLAKDGSIAATFISYDNSGTAILATNVQAALTELDADLTIVATAVSSLVIDDLGDVDTTTTPPILGDALIFDGADWAPDTVPGGVTSIDDLSDVDTTTSIPIVGEHLEWDGSDWIPAAAGGGGSGGSGVGSWSLITEEIFSADLTPSVDWANPEDYSIIKIVIEELVSGDDGANVRAYARQATVRRDTGGDYSRNNRYQKAASVQSEGNAASANWLQLTRVTTWEMGNTAGEGGDFEVNIFNPGGTSLATAAYITGGYLDTAGEGVGTYAWGNLILNSAEVDGFELDEGGGATLTGTFRVYGMRKDGGIGGFITTAPATELTISSGVVTVTQTNHTIDTEADAATDDLDTINGGAEGNIIILSSENSARDATLKDGVGNLVLAGDFTLATTSDRITLQFDGTNWVETSRSTN